MLGAAAVFETGSFVIALRQFLAANRGSPFWRSLQSSKDPTTYTVLAEDAAALGGLAVAALGVYLRHHLDLPILDGAASVVIGILLAGVAILLNRESRGLLIGEGVTPETALAIRHIALRNPRVRAADTPLPMYLGPEEMLLTLDVLFERDSSADEIVAAVANIENYIRLSYPRINRIYIEARSIIETTRPPAHPDTA